MIIKNLTFGTTINDRGWINNYFWFEPSMYCKVLSGWALEFSTSKQVSELINNINLLNEMPLPNSEVLTSNECHIYIKEKGLIVFDMECVTQLQPVILPLEDALFLFNKYFEWLEKYESCQIPGIIPQSKLATWSCVPNEYVKPEYWELLKQQEPDKSN